MVHHFMLWFLVALAVVSAGTMLYQLFTTCPAEFDRFRRCQKQIYHGGSHKFTDRDGNITIWKNRGPV